MPSIRIYEGALCCSTGLCGPDVDQALVTFTADVRYLAEIGADIARNNLASDPGSFATHEVVRDYLYVAGSEGLPLTLVDQVTVMTGSYPTRTQLLGYAGIADVAEATAGITTLELRDSSSGSCGASGCC
jgi:hypothetical protein